MARPMAHTCCPRAAQTPPHSPGDRSSAWWPFWRESPPAAWVYLGASLACGAAIAQPAGDVAPPTAAASAPGAPSTFRFLVGARLAHAPRYAGSDHRQTTLSPVWALQYGRFRISAAGGGGLLAFRSDDTAGPGASADLLDRRGLRLGAGLRIDNGRDASNPESREGLSEVRRTVRGRLYVSYALSERWNLSSSVSQDLLGHDGGALMLLDTTYRLHLNEHTDLAFGAGMSYGDARYMRSRFGISPETAEQAGLPAYQPGADLFDLRIGVDLIVALSSRWVAFAGLDLNRLQGQAAASPLTREPLGLTVSTGVVYRCCR